MEDRSIITGLAIICLAMMETALICTGQDGQFILPVCSLIAGLAGYTVGAKYGNRENPMH